MTSVWHEPSPYRIEVQLEIKTKPLNGASIPVELKNFKLLNIKGYKLSCNQLCVVRHDDTGNPIVFDSDMTDNKKYHIPYRFEPDYDGFALPQQNSKGKLIFLAANKSGLQKYCIYFDTTENNCSIDKYGGLIGDGDVFIQKTGRLAVSSESRPVYYGKELFGTKGLLVAANYTTGIFFFQEIQNTTTNKPDYINKGRLCDHKGNLITGIPTVFDFNNNGKLDLIIGKLNGSVCWYENTGSNKSPVFTGPKPIKTESGQPVEIAKYLEGKYRQVRMTDGTINTRYPKMRIIMHHGHATRLNCTPVFADCTQSSRHDLILGTPGDFLLYFQQTENGFKEGVFLTDTDGNAIRCGAYPTVVDWNNDGKPDLLCGDYHGYVYYLENVGSKNGIPIFENRGQLNIERDNEYSFPLVCKFQGKHSLLVGDNYGEIKSYKLIFSEKGTTPEINSPNYIEMSNAPITRQMPLAQYVDLDKDGIKDIVSGDIKGGLYFYKNIGTNLNPVFAKCKHLCDTNGPIMIMGGPDPQTPNDGYSKVFAYDLTNNGWKDLIVGTGLGKIIVFENDGLDSSGNPKFKEPKVLKDIEGNEIRCHHMSSPLIVDWDGDGVDDLIIGGQKKVHFYPDDDLDPSQLRWYRGINKDGKLEFLPYTPITAEGDMEITYRPIPSGMTEEKNKRILHIGQKCFRQTDLKTPDQIEFQGHEPWRIAFATEPVICAYHSFGELAENDSVIVQGSCVGWLYAFRDVFLNNNGYPPIQGEILSLQSRDDNTESPEQTYETFSFAGTSFPAAPHAEVKGEYSLQTMPQSFNPDDINSPEWENIHRNQNFFNSAGQPLPENLKCTAQFAIIENGLCFRIHCQEPEMNSLICTIDHNNGPLIDYNEDRLEIYIDTNQASQHYYGWLFNANGYYKEMKIQKETGQPEGTWQVGNNFLIQSQTIKNKNGWTLQCTIPFSKLEISSLAPNPVLCQIRRSRNLYATENIPAHECKTSDTFYWPQNNIKWCRLIYN